MSNCFEVELAEWGNYVIVMVKCVFLLYLPNVALNFTLRITMKRDNNVSFGSKSLGALTLNKRLSKQLKKLHKHINM